MSYLVLARKWRPKRFAELVGQEHVVRALTNALGTGRVHHAFLFTGTRGVGKTTIARIFAKSLNCERGTSADPCGECAACLDIDAGRYIDLLEIDAASNTGVDDVREVIDNAQYMPSRGRVKVYLIDEVHMLSKSAFNALLKTLEEPPGHVKFLLATTDPQKLPVTVLSRCLQFNLKRLDEQQIAGQMARILEAERIGADESAIRQLAKAADGSLRDGLSLLDQAIAYGGAGADAPLEGPAVAAMLGSVDRTRVGAVLAALADGDGKRLLDEVAVLAEFSPDWGSVLDTLGDALHRIQVRQLVPDAAVEADGVEVDALAAQLRPELVQLWYQMCLGGRRDLPLAPSPRAGFEMSVLRMLAFRPGGGGGEGPGPGAGGAPSGGRGEPARGQSAAAQAAAAMREMGASPRERASAERPAGERRVDERQAEPGSAPAMSAGPGAAASSVPERSRAADPGARESDGRGADSRRTEMRGPDPRDLPPWEMPADTAAPAVPARAAAPTPASAEPGAPALRKPPPAWPEDDAPEARPSVATPAVAASQSATPQPAGPAPAVSQPGSLRAAPAAEAPLWPDEVPTEPLPSPARQGPARAEPASTAREPALWPDETGPVAASAPDRAVSAAAEAESLPSAASRGAHRAAEPIRDWPVQAQPAPDAGSAAGLWREPEPAPAAAASSVPRPSSAEPVSGPAFATAHGPGSKPESQPEPQHEPKPDPDLLHARAEAPRAADPITVPARAAAPAAGIADDHAWHALIDHSGLRGPARILAEHAGFVGYAGGVLTLALGPDDEHLKAPALIRLVADALAPRLGAAPQIRFEAAASGESLHARNQRARDERQANAEDLFMNDPQVRQLIERHGAKLVPDSIRPFDEA